MKSFAMAAGRDQWDAEGTLQVAAARGMNRRPDPPPRCPSTGTHAIHPNAMDVRVEILTVRSMPKTIRRVFRFGLELTKFWK